MISVLPLNIIFLYYFILGYRNNLINHLKQLFEMIFNNNVITTLLLNNRYNNLWVYLFFYKIKYHIRIY